MKVGISSMFAFRPHVEHLAYLANILRNGGYEVVGFDCVSAVDTCYPRNLRGKSRVVECSKCLLGGIRSYGLPVTGTVKEEFKESLPQERFERMSVSSVATVFRTEPTADLHDSPFRALQSTLRVPLESVYGSARRWLEQSKIEGVLLFNGRMDLTAAVAAACEDSGVPYITTERAWLGHGIHMIPNGNCLDISPISKLCQQYMDAPLLRDQAILAGKLAADRYLRANTLEWRLYNANEERAVWPGGAGGIKLLIAPSSRNEFEGHHERMCQWNDYTEAMDEVIQRLAVPHENVVIRCHPNWAEVIGKSTGEKSEVHYTRWARERGYQVIGSYDKRSTYDLIGEADVVLVNGSSTGIEAAIRGKRVISVGHCTYEAAGFSIQIHQADHFHKLDGEWKIPAEAVVRRVLRYLYIHAARFPQYVNHVRGMSTTECEYIEGADPERLVRLLQTGELEADDARRGVNTIDEDAVVNQIMRGEWTKLASGAAWKVSGERMPVNRRAGLRWIDALRQRLPRGDR